MIVCPYEELTDYSALLSHLSDGLACIEKLRAAGFTEGRYEFEGGFLFVQKGQTKPVDDTAFEVHRRYVDVQYIIEGEEDALYLPMSGLLPQNGYDPDKDIEFLRKGSANPIALHVHAGMCYVAYPQDGHMPCRCLGEPKPYVKIVMKLPAVQEG